MQHGAGVRVDGVGIVAAHEVGEQARLVQMRQLRVIGCGLIRLVPREDCLTRQCHRGTAGLGQDAELRCIWNVGGGAAVEGHVRVRRRGVVAREGGWRLGHLSASSVHRCCSNTLCSFVRAP